MQQIDNSTSSPTLPVPSAPGTAGYFTDGSALEGVSPTYVPAEFLNSVMLEIMNVVMAAGITPNKAVYTQLLAAIENLIEARAGDYATDTGVANAYVIALSPPITAYTPGLTVKFRAANANTAACTLNAGGGVVPLLRDDGSPLQLGDIAQQCVITATYDVGAAGFLVSSIVLSQLGALARLNVGAGMYVDNNGNLSSYAAAYPPDTGAANAYVVAFLPALAAYKNGMPLRFRAVHANTAACTINAGPGAVPLLRNNGTPVQNGDIAAAQIIDATYDAAAGGFLVTAFLPSQIPSYTDMLYFGQI